MLAFDYKVTVRKREERTQCSAKLDTTQCNQGKTQLC